MKLPVRIGQKFGENRTGVEDFYTRFGLPAHEGIDYGGSLNDPVFAAADGVIRVIARDDGVHAYGNHIRLTHTVGEQEYITVYAHLAGFITGWQVGDKVMQGERIGLMGSTGNSSAVHLHFSLKKTGATERGEQQQLQNGSWVVYPSDIIDPIPFFEV